MIASIDRLVEIHGIVSTLEVCFNSSVGNLSLHTGVVVLKLDIGFLELQLE